MMRKSFVALALVPLLAACAAPVDVPVVVETPAEPAVTTLTADQAVALLDRVCGDGSDRFLNFGQRLAIAQQDGSLPDAATFTLLGGSCTLTFAPADEADALRTALSVLGRPLTSAESGGVYIRPNDAVIIFSHDDPSAWTLQTYRAV